MIVGIAIVSIMSWPRSTSFTYFPDTTEGTDRFDFFKKVVQFHPIEKVLAAQDWNIAGAGSKFVLALFTFLYVDILDCTGTVSNHILQKAVSSLERYTLSVAVNHEPD